MTSREIKLIIMIGLLVGALIFITADRVNLEQQVDKLQWTMAIG
jgi:hypothetical protein